MLPDVYYISKSDFYFFERFNFDCLKLCEIKLYCIFINPVRFIITGANDEASNNFYRTPTDLYVYTNRNK